ncbi:MAG: hypothetical protein PHO32_04695 [Candidatus Cloacimonetes bacterium]|nr:hypothetical protein [Candidatus Cloacimonadota bacterium]
MIPYKIIIIALLLLTSLLPIAAQSLFQSKTISLEQGIVFYKLSDSPIIHHSESVWADSTLLLNGINYIIDYKNSTIKLLNIPLPHRPDMSTNDSIPLPNLEWEPSTSTIQLKIEYFLVPPSLTQPLQSWAPQARSDSLFNSIKRRSNSIFTTDTKLDIKGAKTFAITFSDDESFGLKQSLFVNLSGELAKGVFIAAQLSDSESKLSPEGDSKELSSLDNVFLKIYGDRYELAMGDVELKFTDTRYMEYYGKFEGINAWYKNKHFMQAAYSAGSGKTTSLTLDILDGKQGPYYLRANDFQQGFIVISGSEEIYVDGSLWNRGVDYSIDYAEGSVSFKRLISSTNAVLARFQYTADYYPQSSYLNSTRFLVTPNLSISHHFIWQQDDKNSPLLYNFTAADLDSLHSSGDSQAWGEGVFSVEPGVGVYLRRISSLGNVYYEYAPNDTTANYTVVFSYVGYGNGDYEEFSPGKFRYLGIGMGSWLPQKRLVAPEEQANLDLSIVYDSDAISAGVETLGSYYDKNSLSELNVTDNYSGIAYFYAEIPVSLLKLRIDHEQRGADSFLLGKYRDPNQEYDFASLMSADSLAQHESNVVLTLDKQMWKTSLLLRYKDIYDLYEQRAIRFSTNSEAISVIPSLNLRSTLSKQSYFQQTYPDDILQNHQGEAAWSIGLIKLKLDGLLNRLESKQIGSGYQKFTPAVSIGNSATYLTNVSFSNDATRVKNNNWKTVSSSQTYALRQMINSTSGRLDLDFTHKELKKEGDANPKTNYDLVNFRLSHDFFKQAISLYSNYQLNQTEFYPKIRELHYIGNGIGLYDSTGVSVTEGDYDYIYITSPNGSLSSEINTLLTLYLKPGNLINNTMFKRWQTDTTVNLSEQSSNRDDWKSYIFYPGTVFNTNDTLYGKQSYQQNLWLDILPNRITGNLQFAFDRILDQRYQTQERSSSLTRTAQLDVKSKGDLSSRLQVNLDSIRDSRYQSKTEMQSFSLLVQKKIATLSNLQTELIYASETGEKLDGSENYRLSSYTVTPTVRSVWMQKYRLSASASLTRNYLSGSSYFSFLPQKRPGWIPSLNTTIFYRMNSFSSISLDYRFTDYPKQKGRQDLKLEFKAEL